VDSNLVFLTFKDVSSLSHESCSSQLDFLLSSRFVSIASVTNVILLLVSPSSLNIELKTSSFALGCVLNVSFTLGLFGI
jgi:hypothetical protein